MSEQEMKETLAKNIEYRELLKSRLPNAGINYKDIQLKLRSTRAIIAHLEEKLGK